jgi:lipoprotein signal peptidase
VFNLADSVIVGSAVLMAWLSLRGVSYDGSGPDRSDE